MLDKRHFTIVEGNKEHGLFVSSSPSSAARKVVSKLSKNGKKVVFELREITQGSKKKIYGPYEGIKKKLSKPIKVGDRVYKHESIVHKIEKKGGEITISNKLKNEEKDYPRLEVEYKYKSVLNKNKPEETFKFVIVKDKKPYIYKFYSSENKKGEGEEIHVKDIMLKLFPEFIQNSNGEQSQLKFYKLLKALKEAIKEDGKPIWNNLNMVIDKMIEILKNKTLLQNEINLESGEKNNNNIRLPPRIKFLSKNEINEIAKYYREHPEILNPNVITGVGKTEKYLNLVREGKI